MLFLKYILLAGGVAVVGGAVAIVVYDIVQAAQRWRLLARPASEGARAVPPLRPVRWQAAAKLGGWAALPLLASLSVVVVPSGYAGVRVSQLHGTRPGTLYPGVHFIKPLLESVALYDIRDHIFTTAAPDKKAEKEEAERELLQVQSKEGLTVGLAIAVRYRLDANRLDHVHANLPQPVEEELVLPVVASAFRQVVPNYTVREVFATKREEVRQRAADVIVNKLSPDAVVVKEVMLRDIVLPMEYAKGLEGLLLKEQENERLNYEIEIKQKQVRTAELEAEAQKTREIKRAEADAHVRVLQAKAEADAMQHTLPLKEKQIQQTRLEAQARKEATLKNAEAAAEAKVIDSKAELERRKLLAEAEANRIRVTSAADAERLKLEALVLKQNPLLIQKIVAERLSDKVQIMMVPMDGKFFFANDVLRGTPMIQMGVPDDPEPNPDEPRKRNGTGNGNGNGRSNGNYDRP
jgi:regulator of protease activity HflC (stomatin/prohibitin superfamily)